MSTKRKVMVSHYIRCPKTGSAELKGKGEAIFHEFVFESFEGKGSCCIAIIEWPNGEVESVNAELIRFLDSEVQHEQL